MRIDSVETFAAGSSLYVRLTTDSGLSGVGESTCFGWPRAVADVVSSFESYLLGCDPFDVEQHWLQMYRTLCFRGMVLGGAISAIDQALWDLKGKHFEVPVWQLLGGRSRRGVRAMKVISGGTPDEVAAQGAAAVDAGYTAVKVILFQHSDHRSRHARALDDMVVRLNALREQVGWDLDIGVELHRNLSPGDSLQLMDEIVRFRPFFVEDPIPPDSVLSLGEISAKSRLPMAAGERNTTIWEFREYVEHAGLAYVRPDVGIAGGITHLRKICALAEAHHQGVLPHAVPSGPVATAAHVQLGITVPNWEAQEHVEQDSGVHVDVVDRVPDLVDGWLLPRDAPGLGIALDDAGLARHEVSVVAVGAPQREDGSVAIR